MALITCPECGKRLYKIHSACPQCAYPFSRAHQTKHESLLGMDLVFGVILLIMLPIVGFYGTDILIQSGVWLSKTDTTKYKVRLGRLQSYLSRCTTGSPTGGNVDRCLYLQDLVEKGYVDYIPLPPKNYAIVHKFNLNGNHKLTIQKDKETPDPSQDCFNDGSFCVEVIQ